MDVCIGGQGHDDFFYCDDEYEGKQTSQTGGRCPEGGG
jgi:hypothetical protein